MKARTVIGALATAADRSMMRRSARRRSPPVDNLLELASASANYSAVWFALAVAAAATGGQRGKRAAPQGVLAIACASATVNGPLKLWAGCRRPTPHRAIRRKLRTSYFPSGHAASAFAFAFATAATRELPEAGALLLPLAATVAYSRVYLGAPYPSDVVPGAVIGVAVGIAARPGGRKLSFAHQSATRGHAPVSAPRNGRRGSAPQTALAAERA